MSFDALKKEYAVLLNALSVTLFDKKCDFDTETDWQAVFKESCEQSVCALAFDGLRGFKKLPKDIALVWLKYASLQIGNSITVLRNHGVLDEFMNKIDLPYCILKGSATAFYYPNPTLRVMGDVDFLVPLQDFETVSKALQEAGYEMSHEDHICHRVFKKEKTHLEMHFEPAGMPEGENRQIVENQFADIFEKYTSASLEGVKFNNPAPMHHCLVLLLHTYHHLLAEGVGLRHFCDWAVFANSFSNDEFESAFKQPLCEVGLWRFAQILSLTACDYLGMPYKEWMGSVDEKVTYELICDILSGGNFGRKDKSRRQQGDMISNRGKDGVTKSGLVQFIKNKNKRAADEMRLLKKAKFLQPIGFIFVGIRYFFMVVFKKRDAVDIQANVQNAEKRRQIYSQFKLFEKGE